MRVATALVGVERAELREPAGEGELDSGLRTGGPGDVRRRAHQHALPAPRTGPQPDRGDAHAERPLARVVEQRGPDVELAAEQRSERGAVERGEPGLRDRRADEDRGGGAEGEQRVAADDERDDEDGGDRGGRARPGEQPADDRRQDDMARVAQRDRATRPRRPASPLGAAPERPIRPATPPAESPRKAAA